MWGPTGPTGATGPTGLAGADGVDGIDGADGSTGPAGADGNDGPMGMWGPTGPTGLTGPMGMWGPTGPSGPIGAKGNTGNTGNTGAVGPQGPIGATGPMGMPGATGPQGTYPDGTATGEMMYWDGTNWLAVAPAALDSATFMFVSGVPTWVGGTPPVLAIGQYPAGRVNCAGVTTVVDVTNSTTGRIWMDRNLGAAQVATSSTDAASYGDLYQWGRRADGHQCRASDTTSTLSSIDQPAHGNFILAPSGLEDWRIPQSTNLWQGVNGINNPCPNGYRIPTEPELEAERLSWSTGGEFGAFASVLKLPKPGGRSRSSGGLFNVGNHGYYLSSTVSSADSRFLLFYSFTSYMETTSRVFGRSVRCIKD